MLDFLVFRRMLTSLVLGLAYYLAVGVTWYYCFLWLQSAPQSLIPIGSFSPPGGSQMQVDARAGIVGVAIAVPLVLRVLIEVFMVLFRINESLTSTNKQVRTLHEEVAGLGVSLKERR